jgi:hypothetical protein
MKVSILATNLDYILNTINSRKNIRRSDLTFQTPNQKVKIRLPIELPTTDNAFPGAIPESHGNP